MINFEWAKKGHEKELEDFREMPLDENEFVVDTSEDSRREYKDAFDAQFKKYDEKSFEKLVGKFGKVNSLYKKQTAFQPVLDTFVRLHKEGHEFGSRNTVRDDILTPVYYEKNIIAPLDDIIEEIASRKKQTIAEIEYKTTHSEENLSPDKARAALSDNNLLHDRRVYLEVMDDIYKGIKWELEKNHKEMQKSIATASRDPEYRKREDMSEN